MYRVGSQVTWILKALFPCCALVGYGSAMMPTACTLWAWCRTCPWEPVMLGVSLTMSWTPRQKIANADGLAHKAYHHARVIMNDMQPTHPCLVSDWFTHKFHLYVISILYLGQNVSHKDPSHRTISLNANYVVRFKNPMTCPRSPTWTSKCTLAAMASWQLPFRTQQSCVPPATWSWLQPDNAWEISPAQHPISWWRLSWGTCLQARLLGLRRWGGQSRRRQQKGPLYSPTCSHHGNSNLCSRSPPAQLLPSAIAPMMAHSSSSSSASPTITAPRIIAVAWQLHRNHHSKAMMPGLTSCCDPLQLSQARRCHMHLEQGTAQGRQAADSWRW